MSDLIDRQAAIDALGEKPLAWTEGEYELGLQNQWQSDVDALKAVPSAQPDLSEYSDKLWKAAYERGKAEAQPDLDEVYAHAETEAEARYHAEIVRCKDCKYYQTRQKSGFLPQCCWFDVLTKPNDFCSNGRKENR